LISGTSEGHLFQGQGLRLPTRLRTWRSIRLSRRGVGGRRIYRVSDRRPLREFHALENVGDGSLTVVKPLGRPNTMNAPSHTLDNQLPEEVTVSRGPGTVVGDAVALDSQEITAVVAWIADCQIDTILAGPDLHVHLQPSVNQGDSHSLFEFVRSRIRPNRRFSRKFTIPFRKFQEIPERHSPPIVRVHAREVLRPKAGHQNALPFGPCDKDVRAAPTTFDVGRAEIHADAAGVISAVPDADDPGVSLIALDILKGLHEYSFRAAWVKKGGEIRPCGQSLGDRVLDGGS